MGSLLHRVGFGSLLRIAIAALVVAVAVADEHPATVLPGALTLMLMELIPATLWPPRVRVAAGVLVASLTVALSIVYTPAALPLLLLSAFHAGEMLNARSVIVERAACAAATSTWLLLLTRPGIDRTHPVTSLIQWWALGLALGLLAAWANRVQPANPDAVQRQAALEATRLSARLQTIARRLPLGLDPAAVAQNLLDDVYALTTVDVCAVLLQVDEQTASPLALRGATRLPWRDPIRSEGALHDAWTERTLVVQVREPDVDGRRRGSSMLCVPITENRTMLALLVLERRTVTDFAPEEIAKVQAAVDWVAPQLQAALHFGELQRSATFYEREQLAREMHNGVAQDLAFVGFGLDALARHPAIQADVAHEVRELRGEVSRMLADIRLSIGDLRVGVGADEGLGRVLSAQLQHFGATTGSMVQVELRESTVRLPVDVEQALTRLSHELLVDARTGRASSVRVVLEAEPPMATFLLEHDGSTQWDAGERMSPALAKLGAQMNVVRPEQAGGLAVIVHVGEIPARANLAFEVAQPQQLLAEEVGA
jgi:signal transduction histidine kinase